MISEQKEPQFLMIENSNGTKVKKVILDEDSFVDQLDKIIERDFFPDLKKLKVANQFVSKIPIDATPSTSNEDKKDELKIDENITLGQFLSKYTSEDNASFIEVIRETNKRHQQQYPWFYLDEEEVKLQIENSLQLPSIEQQNRPNKKHEGNNNILTWPYKNKNAVMFNPDGCKLTVEEQIEENASNKQKIVFENTRFKKAPFRKITYRLNTNQSNVSGTESGTSTDTEDTTNKRFLQSKYEPAGNIVNLERKEYKLVDSTPLIEPNDLDSPFMTWGEIESTPMHLNEEISSTPSSGRFKIPQLSAREQIALKLTDDYSKSKKQKLNDSKQKWTKSPALNSPRTPKLNQLSPAVQQFAHSKLRLNIKNDYKNMSFPQSSKGKTPSPYLNLNIKSPISSLSSESNRSDNSTITNDLLKLSK